MPTYAWKSVGRYDEPAYDEGPHCQAHMVDAVCRRVSSCCTAVVAGWRRNRRYPRVRLGCSAVRITREETLQRVSGGAAMRPMVCRMEVCMSHDASD